MSTTTHVSNRNWVRPSIIERDKGLTCSALDKAKNRGHFIEGKHWKKDRQNRIWWHFEALDEWVENGR